MFNALYVQAKHPIDILFVLVEMPKFKVFKYHEIIFDQSKEIQHKNYTLVEIFQAS